MKQLLCILLLALPLWLKDCFGPDPNQGRQPVVETEGKILYLDEITSTIPQGTSPADSLKMAELYINNWIKETIVYEEASRNLKESEEIRTMVEAYRHSLIIYEYQQQALAKKMEQTVTDEDIARYYEQNAQRFLSSQNLVKGIFIKVPRNAAQLDQLKKWGRKRDTQAMEHIETYCMQRAQAYENFREEWVTLDDVIDQIPYEIKDQTKFLKAQSQLEVTDNNYTYLFYIDHYLLAGSPEPIEFVSKRIRNILINSSKTEFLHQLEEDMVNEAMEKGQIIFYDIPQTE